MPKHKTKFNRRTKFNRKTKFNIKNKMEFIATQEPKHISKPKPNCEVNKTFEEKELDILRSAVDKAEERQGKAIAQSPDIIKIINILETFLKRKHLICYGGTAINNILPEQDQFYNKDVEIPDYDFYSANALNDAKELADIYNTMGYNDVEARAAVHVGTYKVFVNFIPVADVTQMEPKLFKVVLKESLKINGIHYAPPNYLRMSVYKELSRPMGDISRWEKVYKRLVLLNKNYPLKNPHCNAVKFMRDFEGTSQDSSLIYDTLKDAMIDLGLVFIGGFASSLYGKYMPKEQQQFFQKVPDFDVLADDPKTATTIIKERLLTAGFKNIKIYKKPGVGEIIAPHYEVVVDNDTVCFIYEPLACHSYNTIKIGHNTVKVATIDTMLNFFLAFIYADRPYYDIERILCMAQYLFEVQEKNRLEQKGLLKRFSINCYGNNSENIETIRAKKAEKFKELKGNKGSKEYDEYFLRYTPGDKKGKKLAELKMKGEEKEKEKGTVKRTKVKRTKVKRKTTQKTTQIKKRKDNGFLF
jgi:hypothetical protein